VRGQGPDLVLLHGWGMSDACWGAFADRLSRRFRLHQVTLPGHGDDRDTDWSADEVIDRVIDRTPPAAWLGWSLGGTLALLAALSHPQRVTRLIMVAATPCFVAREHWPHGVLPFEFERFEAYCRDDSADTVRRFRSRVADGGPNPSAVMLVLEQAAVAGHQALLAGLSILADTDEVAALADLGYNCKPGSEEGNHPPCTNRA
jgi:pimeloyl-[acyl-carrier protein] methyl ester esterase